MFFCSYSAENSIVHFLVGISQAQINKFVLDGLQLWVSPANCKST